MDVHGLVAAQFVAQLANRLEEWQPLDVPDGAADFTEDEVFVLEIVGDEVLDGVGDVGDDLDGGAQVITAALLGDDVGINPPRRHVVALARGNASKAFVMAEVEVGLGTVVGDVDLAVLIGRHGARIDVDVGVKLAQPHLEPARLKQRAEGRRCKTFTE